MQKVNLNEDIARKLQMMCNYNARVGLNEMTYLNNGVTVGEADDNGDDATNGGAPVADPASGGAAPAGNPGADPNAMSGASADGPGVMGGGPNAMGGVPVADPAAGGDAEGGAMPPEGFNPQQDLTAGDFESSGDMEQPGDEVLDVTELTDKQDDIEKEISEVGDKFDKVMKALGSFEELLRANDEKIEDLKAEYERRNPTQVEKLSMQTAKSYPFSVTPEEFWKEKEATSNYSTEDDDNGKEQGQYVITANDVNGDTNWKAIADSLDDEDFMYHQTLDKIMQI